MSDTHDRDRAEGWNEYRRMIVGWHEDEVKAREGFTTALSEINTTLNTMKGERKITAWVAGVLIPAVVALASVGIAHAIGW